MRNLFTGLCVSMTVFSVHALAQSRPVSVVTCDQAKRVMAIDQVQYEGGKLKVSGFSVAVQSAQIPEMVSTGKRRSFDPFSGFDGPDDIYWDLKTVGIKAADGQVAWYWNQEQESEMREAIRLARGAKDQRSTFAKVYSRFSNEVSEESKKASELFQEKKRAFAKRASDFGKLLENIATTSCETYGFSVQLARRIDLECSVLEVAPERVNPNVPSGFKIGVPYMKPNWSEADAKALSATLDKPLFTGTYDACDGFARAK